jgi:hypothetical protein
MMAAIARSPGCAYPVFNRLERFALMGDVLDALHVEAMNCAAGRRRLGLIERFEMKRDWL